MEQLLGSSSFFSNSEVNDFYLRLIVLISRINNCKSLNLKLKDLQDLGCNKEFNNLMDYLKETEHDVLNETISRRLEIFNKIRNNAGCTS